MQRKKSSPKSLGFSLNPIPGMNHTIREMEKHGLSPREVAAILVGGWLLGVVASALMAYGLASHRTELFSIGLTGQLISLAGPWAYLAIRVYLEQAKKKRKK